jgi:hypothetical protein
MVEITVNVVELAGLKARNGTDATGYAAGIGPLLWITWVAAVCISTLTAGSARPRL